jgi:urea transport system permease protein
MLLRLAAMLLWLLPLLAGPTAAAETFEAAVQRLDASGFGDKQAAVEALATLGDERAPGVLRALLDGDLYARRGDGKVVIARREGRDHRLSDPLTGESLGSASSRDLKRIALNNQLRARIRAAIATLNLGAASPAARLAAVTQLIDRPDPEMAEPLRAALAREEDSEVRAAMQTAVAMADLSSAAAETRLAAIALLDGQLHPSARNALTRVSAADADEQVRAAATTALKNLELKLQLYRLAETIFFGLGLGAVLVLAAIGLAITFGVMGVINMAHGELMMLGAYTTYMIQQALPNHIAWSLPLAVPAAFLVSGLVGIVIERGVIRFLYGRPLETLLATFGISLILQQLVRTLVSPQNVPVSNPSWMSGSLQLNPVLSLTLNRMYIIAFCLVVFALLLLVMKRTRLGLEVRAVSQNRAMARAMGVRSGRVDALTFGLGSGIAGVAGVALSQLTNVGPNLGQSYIIDSFMVVVFGGVGNLWGTLVAGMSLGVANKFLEPWSGAVLAKILVLVFIILFIQKRPRGLFPQKGRAVEA